MPVINTKVLTTTDQGLTELQKETARKNIDAIRKVDGVEGNIVTVGRDGEVQDSQVSIHVFRDVQADWADEAPDSPHHIRNKPEQLLADARVEDDVLVIDKLYGGETVEFSGMSAQEREKLGGIETGAQVNVIEEVQVDGTELVVSGKVVNIPGADDVVKGVVLLTDDPDSEAAGTAATTAAIRAALANFGGFMIVELDQVTGKPDVDNPSTKYIYLTKAEGSGKTDPYTEWIYVVPEQGEPGWEVIGETSVDLTPYYTSDEVESRLDTKVDKVTGKGLSTNDYTTDEKTKLSGIETGAQANIIESVKVDGTALSVDANKAVNIPLASATDSGNETVYVTGAVTGQDKERWDSWGSNEYDVPLFVDQRIMLLWYGTGWGEVLAPSRGIANPTIGYDPNGPLDVSGTSWTGTPYISRYNLGGRSTGPWLVDNKGIHWTQESITSQISKNKPFTIEFWLKDDYPATTYGFGDGQFPVTLLGKTGFELSGTDTIPTLGIGGYYGMITYQEPYNNGSTNTGLTTHSIGAEYYQPWNSKDAWVHLALTYDGSGNSSGMHLYADGREMLDQGHNLGYLLRNDKFDWIFNNPQALSVMYNGYTNGCDWKMAQLAMFNYCKYTGNFTPQTKPYCLGVD